jgi:hypothetical protein
MLIAIVCSAVKSSCGMLLVMIMARASRAYIGNRQSVGTPTLSRNDYFQLIKMIRKERERVAQTEADCSEVRPGAEGSQIIRS